MYLCLNTGNIGVDVDWKEGITLAKRHGFDGFDLPIDPAVEAAAYTDVLEEHGIRPGGTSLPVDFRGDEHLFQRGLKDLAPIAERAAAVGQNRFYTWVLPASDELTWEQNVERHVKRFAAIAAVLGDAGCTLGLEFLGPRELREGRRYSFPHTMEQMLDVAAAAGDNVGLLLDCWHWYTSLGTVEEIRVLRPEQVVYVHVNDAPRGIGLDRQVDVVRRLPGETGVIDIGGFLYALRSIGYDGPIVAEPFVRSLATKPAEEAVQVVGAAMRRIWAAAPLEKLPRTMQVIATGKRTARLVEAPVPRPEGSQVVVRLHACPICGSNLGAFAGDGEWVNVGHEGAGEVVAVEGSSLLQPGDRVALAPLNGCGRCPACLRGDAIYCSERPEIHGTFAEFTRVTDVMCTRLPDDIDYEHGSLLGCGLGPGYEAISRIGVLATDTVVITGLGPVGLGTTALAAFHGAQVVAIDPEPYRRELAERLGAALSLDPQAEQFADRLTEVVGPDGISRGIDCSGNANAERMLVDRAAVRGRIAFVGENRATIPMSPSDDFIRKGLMVVGCWHMNILETPRLFAFLRRAPDKADMLISHRFPFTEAQKAFDTFASRKSAKVLMMPPA